MPEVTMDHLPSLSPANDTSERSAPRSAAQLLAAPRGSKLRASCDTCGKAKIKCDRNQPACGRCVSQGIACVYGVSRKAGKPPRRRPAGVMGLPNVSQSSSSPWEAGAYSDRSGSAPYTPPKRVSTDSGLGSDTLCFNADDTLQDWLAFDDMAALGLPTPTYSDADPNYNQWKGFEQPGFILPLPALPAMPSTMPPSMSTSSSTSSSALVNAWLGDETVNPSSVCCTQKAKETMRMLYCANPSSSDPNGQPARVLDLGSLLSRNRDVVARLKDLLLCPCARTPHCAMLYASIISRVLLWYKQHAAANTSSRDQRGSTSSSSSMQSTSAFSYSAEALEHADMLLRNSAGSGLDEMDTSGSAVLPMPVTVGSFQSENLGLQTALSACLLMGELAAVGDLISEFAAIGKRESGGSRQGTPCPLASEYGNIAVDVNLFESLSGWLWTEHHRIARDARAGMSMLDKTLGF